MDSTRQVIRWSIPGWVFLFILTFLQVSTHIGWGESPAYILSSGLFRGISPAGVALLVTSGVPLGFLLYQIYYWLYGHVFPFGIVPLDRASALLAQLPDEWVAPLFRTIGASFQKGPYCSEVVSSRLSPWYTVHRLLPEYRSRKGRRDFQLALENNKCLVKFLLTKIAITHDAVDLRAQPTAIADLYHGIGAARVSLVVACVVHAGHNALFSILNGNAGLVSTARAFSCLALSYGLVAWLTYVLSATRSHCLDTLQSVQLFSLRYYLQHQKEAAQSSEKAS